MTLPNIVIIVFDDLGIGDPSCYNGSSQCTTDGWDAVATAGVRLTGHHCPDAVCTPSRYGLLTGQCAHRTWLPSNVLASGFARPLLTPGTPTIASVARNAGYATAMFGKWHQGVDGWGLVAGGRYDWSDNQIGTGVTGNPATFDYSVPLTNCPLDHGFDYAYYAGGTFSQPPYCWMDGRLPVQAPSVSRATNYFGASGSTAGYAAADFQVNEANDVILAKFQTWMGNHTGPFFAYLALHTPHNPVEALPEDYDGISDGNAREDAVMWGDAIVQLVRTLLSVDDVLDDTLLIVTSDHGAVAGNAGGNTSNTPYRSVKGSTWEGGLRVPFCAQWTNGSMPSATVRSKWSSHLDMIGLVSELTGQRIPSSAIDCQPGLLDYLLTGKRYRTGLKLRSAYTVQSMIVGHHKAIPAYTGGQSGPFDNDASAVDDGWLVDLATDADESSNLASTRAAVKAQIEADLVAVGGTINS